jgi:spore coat protein U-like protein
MPHSWTGVPRAGKIAAQAFCFIAAVSAWSSSAEAQVSGNLNVQLNITASCDVSGSSSGALASALLDFGNATLLQTAINSTTAASGTQALQMLCNPGVPYTLTFSAGQNATLPADRAMKLQSGTELVRYQIYTDAARGTVLTTKSGTQGFCSPGCTACVAGAGAGAAAGPVVGTAGPGAAAV